MGRFSNLYGVLVALNIAPDAQERIVRRIGYSHNSETWYAYLTRHGISPEIIPVVVDVINTCEAKELRS